MKINVNSIARRVEVDNRIPLHYYYRIADNLLKQASVYREENNIVDLYIILLRFSSLVSETIPFHRDYKLLYPNERLTYKKKLVAVLDELESFKPEFHRRVDELNEADAGSQKSQMLEFDNSQRTAYASRTIPLEWPSTTRSSYLGTDKKVKEGFSETDSLASSSLWKYQNDQTQSSSLNTMQVDKQFQKPSVSLPVPKKETLSKHSILGPNGLRGQWPGPSAEMKVQYPCNADFNPAEELSLNHAGQYDHMAVKDNDPGSPRSTINSVLFLDDSTWSRPAEQSWPALATEAMEDPFPCFSIKQPAPPPVLSQVRQVVAPIPPSQVADPRPGPAKSLQHGESSYQNLHG